MYISRWSGACACGKLNSSLCLEAAFIICRYGLGVAQFRQIDADMRYTYILHRFDKFILRFTHRQYFGCCAMTMTSIANLFSPSIALMRQFCALLPTWHYPHYTNAIDEPISPFMWLQFLPHSLCCCLIAALNMNLIWLNKNTTRKNCLIRPYAYVCGA